MSSLNRAPLPNETAEHLAKAEKMAELLQETTSDRRNTQKTTNEARSTQGRTTTKGNNLSSDCCN